MADELSASFLNLNKNFVRKVIPGGQTQGNVVLPADKVFTMPDELERKPKGSQYAMEFKMRDEIEMYKQVNAKVPAGGLHKSFIPERDRMSNVDDLTSVASGLSVAGENELHSSFDGRFNMESRMETASLPIVAEKANIVSMIAANQTVIIRGATGCGKSTQVPQFILDFCYEKKLPCNIVVTQPRRIAAITLAKRVCAERTWEVGSLVGYQVGLDTSHVSEDTRVTYCTTGVLLQILIGEKSLSRYTHIVVDEVHERNQDMDILLIVIRKLLHQALTSVKIILMSATFKVEQFSKYFASLYGIPPNVKKLWAPIIELSKDCPSPHAIYFAYLCELTPLPCKLPTIQEDEPGITDAGFIAAVTLCKEFDRIDGDSVANPTGRRGAVLIFLPGINEIEMLYNLLTSQDKAHNLNWWVLPLHSMITTEEQSKVFQRAINKTRKIILSTNIAESSVTVPDVVYVIDFCLTKQLFCDPNTNFSSLQMSWASRSSCTQRAGRSGRVAAGRVYRLVTKRFYNEVLPEDDQPEMLRGPLERVVLLAKVLDMGPPKAIVGLALDPPDLSSLESAILSLKEKGALLPTLNMEFSMLDGDMTFMGRVMAKLPVDPAIARMILLGHVFSMLRETVIMGAAMTVKSVFSTPFDRRLAAYNGRLAWADSSCSDCISFLNAYNVWLNNKKSMYYDRAVPGSSEAEWGARFFIQIRAMNEVHLLVEDLMRRLRSLGMEEPRQAGKSEWTAIERPLILKIILAGAFYPNYYARGEQGGQVNEKDAVRLLNGHDPYSTVYLSNFPPDQPKELYKDSIKNRLTSCCPEIMVDFDSSSKVYVVFGTNKSNVVNPGANYSFQTRIPGKIKMGVYRAIKMRQIGEHVKINMLPPRAAKELAIQYGIPSENAASWEYRNQVEVTGNVKKDLPSMNTTVMPLSITYHIDAGHFWAQNTDRNSIDGQTWFFEMLNKPELLQPISGNLREGNVYAVPYDDDGGTQFYRGRVISKTPRDQLAYQAVEIHYIDFGNRAMVPVSQIRAFGPELIEKGIMRVPELAFECMLANVQPSIVANQNGLWTVRAQSELQNKIGQGSLFCRIYSVVAGVVILELFIQEYNRITRQFVDVNLNDWLIERGHAQPAEESVFSKSNHEIRMMSDLGTDQQKHYEQLQESKFAQQHTYVQLPLRSERPILAILKGPSSPLEMKVYAQTRVGGHREVCIEQHSVNSVLLDTDAQDSHERLLVAACVGENSDKTRITLRHTTMMPNIHGLPALMCLIFAPQVEFRTNIGRNRLTGALCGLGMDPSTQKSVFPDHDIEVAFDTEITIKDIQDINKLRFWMNQCFVVDEGMERLSEDCTNVLEAQQRIKSSIYGLLKQARKSVPLHMARQPYKWNCIDSKYTIMPTSEESVMENNRMRGVFQFHWFVELRLTPEIKDEMIAKLSEVSNLADRVDRKIRDNCFETCPVCNFTCQGLNSLKVHLNTPDHEEKMLKLTDALRADSEDCEDDEY